MKNSILVIVTALLFFLIACNKSELAPPHTNPYVITSKYAGTYSGQYFESDNGVDSNGVFKHDTTYTYLLKVEDAGNNNVIITHGPIILPTVHVDSVDHFSFVDYNHNIDGHFAGDSLYLYSKALNGTYNYPQWFVIQKLSFNGKRQL